MSKVYEAESDIAKTSWISPASRYSVLFLHLCPSPSLWLIVNTSPDHTVMCHVYQLMAVSYLFVQFCRLQKQVWMDTRETVNT